MGLSARRPTRSPSHVCCYFVPMRIEARCDRLAPFEITIPFRRALGAAVLKIKHKLVEREFCPEASR